MRIEKPACRHMYCICADGGTLSKQKTNVTVDNERYDDSLLMDDSDGFWKSRIQHHGSSWQMNTSNNYDNHVTIRRQSSPVFDFGQDRRQSRSLITSSFSSTATSSATSMQAYGGQFSRRRQSLVEALSNPVTSIKGISPVPDDLSKMTYTASNLSSKGSRPSSSTINGEHEDNEQRLYSVDELVRSERDYVTLLSALHEGFLKPAVRHSELFDVRLLKAIFGNLHQLRGLHEKLLFDLEIAVKKTPVCLGSCFLQHICTRSTFEVYSHYCNNHQRSCRRLSQLYEHDVYSAFFEECRRSCRLPTLRLDAFLLRPVQQLCRYPLLLASLVQRTATIHEDYGALTAALQATQHLLTAVNNRRRSFEQLQELARWQKTVADWKGPDLLLTSTRLVYSGELLCTCYAVCETVPRWRKRVFVFLFDRLLLLCRKDRLKKQLVFKNRFELDGSNKSSLLAGGIWQFIAPAEGKRLLLKPNSKEDAKLWMEAMNKERCIVQQTGRLPTHDEKMLAIEMAKEDL